MLFLCIIGIQSNAFANSENTNIVCSIQTKINARTLVSEDIISGTSVAFESENMNVSSNSLLLSGILANNSQSLHIIELYVVNDIADLSQYAIGVDNDNDGSDGPEFYLSGSATAGEFLYITMFPNENDINMDGNSQYVGVDPDTPIILQNVLAHPENFLNFSTYPIEEQLPEND